MSRLPVELFLALRYLRPKRTFVSVITLISVLGVMLGVAVLIIVISVMSGFDRQLRETILGFNAHVKVLQYEEAMGDYEQVMQIVRSNKNVKAVAPVILGQVMLKTQPPVGKSMVIAPMLRGLDPALEKDVTSLTTNIIAGELNLEDESVLVGIEMARNLRLSVGDRVVIYSPRNLEEMEKNKDRQDAVAILPDEYVVRGIFDVGYYEYNANYLITSIRNAQELWQLPGKVHGLLVMLRDPYQAAAVRPELLKQLSVPELSARELPDAEALAVRLREKTNAVSAYIRGRLSERTRQLLGALPGTGAVALRDALIEDINRMLPGELIFDPDRFEGVTLRGLTEAGLGQPTAGLARARLNRLLLEDAYPGEMPRHPEYRVGIWTEENVRILTALAVEKNVMFYLLIFIVIVAAFGIMNSQITFVVQKTREIGMLKALGASRGQVMWLFLGQSLVVGVVGVASGLGLGMLALRFRNEFLHFMNRAVGLELFPADIYGFTDLPALIDPGDIFLIAASALVICGLAGLVPAWNAGRLKPVEALRHE